MRQIPPMTLGRRFKDHKAFSLMEILTVLVILGISITLFYTVFVTNWLAFQDRILRADLWMDANMIIDRVTEDVRSSDHFTLSTVGNDHILTITDMTGAVTEYAIRSSGIFEYKRPGFSGFSLLSRYLQSEDSFMRERGDALEVKLVLGDDLFFRRIMIETLTEIYPRN